MSKRCPSAFVVVGDADCWSPTWRHIDIGLDSRLRGVRRDYNDSNWRSVVCAGSRNAASGKLYAQMLMVVGASNNGFGLIPVGSESTIQTAQIGSVAGTVAVFRGGAIWHNGATVQSGLPTYSAGDVMGLALYRESGSLKVQFYKNGATEGTAVTLTDGSYRLAASSFFVTHEYFLSVDEDDMPLMPSDCQPWGAAARVADAGGYSPAASLIGAYGSNIGIDAYLRTAKDLSGVDVTGDSARTDRASYGAGLLCWECHIEAAATATKPLVGLVNSAYSMETQYIGATGTASFGYYGSSGQVFINNVSVATYATFTAADRIDVILDPSTGKFWLMKNGTLQAGNPEAGTGQTGTLTGGPWYPAATPFGANARVRFCTHAREHLYRPSYAQAWDGADILPEQHYREALKSAPSVRRAITFAQWGGKPVSANPIGSLGLINTDGYYDRLSDFNLRDQACIAYKRRSDGVVAREWAGIVDSVDQPDAETCSIVVASPLSKLDVRVASPVFALGKPERIPATSRQGSTITADVSQLTNNAFSVYDKALLVTTWTRADTADFSGFTRSVAPAGLQSVGDLQVLRTIATVPILNGGLSAWTAGVPDNWTVFVSGGPSSVTQSGAAAAFFVAAGSGYAEISQGGHTFTAGKRYAFRVNVSAINLGVASSVGTKVRIGAAGGESSVYAYYSSFPVAGEHLVFIDCTVSSSTLYLIVDGASGGSVTVTITDIAAFEADETFTPSKAIAYLVQDLGGLSAADWSYSAPLSPYSPGQLGYWSNQRPTIRAILSDALASLLCDAYPDESGVVQLAWLVPPEEVTGSAAIYRGAITEIDIIGSVTSEDDRAPALSIRGEYQRNYVKHSDADIAGSVGNAARQYAKSTMLENALVLSGTAAADAKALHAFYTHAVDAPPMPRLVVNDFTTSNTPVNGSATVDNRLILLHRCYAVRRRFRRLKITRDAFDSLGLFPGSVFNLTHRRYGLSAGKNVMVVSDEKSALEPTVDLLTWG